MDIHPKALLRFLLGSYEFERPIIVSPKKSFYMGRYTVSGSGADWLRKVIYMNEISRKQIGRIGLSMAINYFTIKGYTVSLPINDTQWYDLIIEKDGIFETV